MYCSIQLKTKTKIGYRLVMYRNTIWIFTNETKTYVQLEEAEYMRCGFQINTQYINLSIKLRDSMADLS